jgi:phosphoglycerate kinase
LKTLDDLLGDGVSGRRVLVRADLNVPFDKADPGVISDDGRIRAVLPTIVALRDAGARVIVCSHLGRPKGAPDPKYTLAPVAARFGELLGNPVIFASDTVGSAAESAVEALFDGQVLLLENLRFNEGETAKDDAVRGAFAAQLAAFADFYVDDAFGAVHRKHASVYDVPALLPHYAGGLVLREVEVLKRVTEDPEQPYVVVLGGSKVSDKLGVIDHLLGKADRILIGGGMMFTFLKAQGHEVGSSLLEADQLDAVRGYVEQAEAKGVEIVLPVDVVAATAFAADADHDVYDVAEIPADRIGLDIGPRSAELFASRLADAKTVFWNGPMGVFEMAPFAEGTRALAQAITEVDGLTVVGGGDSAAAVRTLGFADRDFGHISTGGGASLEYLEGKTLPGLSVLEE